MAFYDFFFQIILDQGWLSKAVQLFCPEQLRHAKLFTFQNSFLLNKYESKVMARYIDLPDSLMFKKPKTEEEASSDGQIVVGICYIHATTDIYNIGYWGSIREGGFSISDVTDIVVDFPYADWLMFNDARRRVPIDFISYQKRYINTFFYLLQDIWIKRGMLYPKNLYEDRICQLTEPVWLKYQFWFAIFYLHHESEKVVTNYYWRLPIPYKFRSLNGFSLLDCLCFLWANANVFAQFKFLLRRHRFPVEYDRGRFRYSPEFSKGSRPLSSLSSYSKRFKLIKDAHVYYEYCRMFWWWKYEEPLVYVQYFPENYAYWKITNMHNFLEFRRKLEEEHGFRTKVTVEDLLMFAQMHYVDEARRTWDAKVEEFKRNMRGEVLTFEDIHPKVDYEEVVGRNSGVWRFGIKNVPYWYISSSEIPYWSTQTEYTRLSGFNPEVRIYLQRSFRDLINQRVWRFDYEVLSEELTCNHYKQVSSLNKLFTRTAFHLF